MTNSTNLNRKCKSFWEIFRQAFVGNAIAVPILAFIFYTMGFPWQEIQIAVGVIFIFLQLLGTLLLWGLE